MISQQQYDRPHQVQTLSFYSIIPQALGTIRLFKNKNITVTGKHRNYHKPYILNTKTNYISGHIPNRKKFLKKMKREQPVGSK